MLIVLYFVIAAFISWIWIDYYRLIEVYGNTNFKYVLSVFFLGAASSLIIIALRRYDGFKNLPIWEDGTVLGDFSFCLLKVALVEECVKLMPYLIAYLVFRSQFKEPIDYIAFAAISGLGFAATLNASSLAQYGVEEVYNPHYILIPVSHMFNSALVGYGIILVKYKNTQPKWFIIPAFLLFAIGCHAYYDFWFAYANGNYGNWMSIPFFILTVSWFATILNNALNNSSAFTYKKAIDSDFVFTRMIVYYCVVYVFQFMTNSFIADSFGTGLGISFVLLMGSTAFAIPILLCVIGRLSRFTLIQGRWQPLRLELPIAFTTGPDASFIIRGGLPAENILNKYYEEYITINPVSPHASVNAKSAFLERKIFLEEEDETYYIIRVFKDSARQTFDRYVLKPKLWDKRFVDEYPIASLMKNKKSGEPDWQKITDADLEFVEWVYIKPAEIAPRNS